MLSDTLANYYYCFRGLIEQHAIRFTHAVLLCSCFHLNLLSLPLSRNKKVSELFLQRMVALYVSSHYKVRAQAFWVTRCALLRISKRPGGSGLLPSLVFLFSFPVLLWCRSTALLFPFLPKSIPAPSLYPALLPRPPFPPPFSLVFFSSSDAARPAKPPPLFSLLSSPLLPCSLSFSL